MKSSGGQPNVNKFSGGNSQMKANLLIPPRGQWPFRHSWRMISLKIKRSSYFTVKNQRSMREEGTTA